MNEFRKSIELTEEQKKEIEKKQYEKHNKDRYEREINNVKWQNAKKRLEEKER